MADKIDVLQEYRRTERMYGDVAKELLQTESINEMPYANSLLSVDGYVERIDVSRMYRPYQAVLHYGSEALRRSGLSMPTEGYITVLLNGSRDHEEVEGPVDDLAALSIVTRLTVKRRILRATLYDSLLNATIPEAAQARHTLSAASKVHEGAGMLGLENGMGIGELVQGVCELADVPLAVAVDLQTEPQDGTHPESALVLYYPVVSSPSLALNGLQHVLKESA